LEAVAGTLTHLHLEKAPSPEYEGRNEEVEVGYELGVALGKLRRLKDLALDSCDDGRAYHALAQGLSASGGGRPLPLLWRVSLPFGVTANADQVASLLLPSVRVFSMCNLSPRSAVLTSCALRQVGYKHIWTLSFDSTSAPGDPNGELCRALRLISRCCSRVVDTSSNITSSFWTILWKNRLP
jgi:hypothetical protein